MKKLILSLTIILSTGLIFSSCAEGEPRMDETNPEHGKHHHNGAEDHHEDHAAEGEINYQCPMECEGEKVYDSPGQCPICKMDLEEKK
jgi:hypothetical protein